MGLLNDLYSMGAETAATAPQPGGITTAHAQAGIKSADRLAATVHREIAASGVRHAFRQYWGQFYNEWQTYRVLNSDREAQSDPGRIVERELPAFIKRLYEWRDALAKETGRPAGQTAGAAAQQGAAAGGAPGEVKEFPWRPILVVTGVVVVGALARSWWAAREKAREEEARQMLDAERARMSALLPAAQPLAQIAPVQQVQYVPVHAPLPVPQPHYAYAPYAVPR